MYLVFMQRYVPSSQFDLALATVRHVLLYRMGMVVIGYRIERRRKTRLYCCHHSRGAYLSVLCINKPVSFIRRLTHIVKSFN